MSVYTEILYFIYTSLFASQTPENKDFSRASLSENSDEWPEEGFIQPPGDASLECWSGNNHHLLHKQLNLKFFIREQQYGTYKVPTVFWLK